MPETTVHAGLIVMGPSSTVFCVGLAARLMEDHIDTTLVPLNGSEGAVAAALSRLGAPMTFHRNAEIVWAVKDLRGSGPGDEG